MASEVGFKVEGLSALVRDLQAVGVEVDDLKDAFSDIARDASVLAAHFAPHVSGQLAASVRGNRAKSKAVVTAGRASVPYAGPVNYGWGTLATNYIHGRYAGGIKGAAAGSFFMQRASDVMEPVAVRRLEAEINETIRRKGLQ